MEQLWSKTCKVIEEGKNLYALLNASFQGVKRLFVLFYFASAGANADKEAGMKDNKKYFLKRGEIKNYNALTDGRNFYDQLINDLIKTVLWNQKSINRVWWWLYNWFFIRLCIFQR